MFNRDLLDARTIAKIEILATIDKHPQQFTQSRLAQQYDCSRKLISTYLAEINQLTQTLFQSAFIIADPRSKQLTIASANAHAPSTLVRAHLLAADGNVQLLLLLLQSTRLTTLEICHQLYISESHLNKKLTHLRQHLAPYALSIQKKAGRYRLTGNSFQIAAYFLTFFKTGLNHQIWPFSTDQQSSITTSLRRFFKAENIDLTQAQLANYVYLVGLLRCQPAYLKEAAHRALAKTNLAINQQLLTFFNPQRLKSLIAQLNLSQADLNLFLCYSQTRDDFYLIKAFHQVALRHHQLVNSDEHQLTHLFKAQILPTFTNQELTAQTAGLPSLLALNYAFTLAERFKVPFTLLSKTHSPPILAKPNNRIHQITQTIPKLIQLTNQQTTTHLLTQLTQQYQALLTHFFSVVQTPPHFTISLFGYESHQETHIVQTSIAQRFQTLFSFTFVANQDNAAPVDLLIFNPNHLPPNSTTTAVAVSQQVTFQDCQQIHETLLQLPKKTNA